MKVLTIATDNPTERQWQMCKCGTCGTEAVCTPQFDFYGEDGEPFECELCFRSKHKINNMVIERPTNLDS